MTTNPIRISMWAGPRNISTTMTRAFENRTDTSVLDEPFYGYYLEQTNAPHPMREEILKNIETNWNHITASLNGPSPNDSAIFFHKQIAYHCSPKTNLPLEWMQSHRPFILIRNPRAMIASFSKKYNDVSPILDSFQVQKKVLAYFSQLGVPCPIVDAADVLKNPKNLLHKLCRVLDISYADDMLKWPSGPRSSDGIWGQHWYDAVNASTGFKPYNPKQIVLSPALENLAAKCASDYHFFWEQRLV